MRRKLTPTEVKISENRMKAIKEEIEYHSYIKQYLELELRLGLEQAFKLKRKQYTAQLKETESSLNIAEATIETLKDQITNGAPEVKQNGN